MQCTKAQIQYYLHLCEQSYVDAEEDYEDWTVQEMGEKIRELLDMYE